MKFGALKAVHSKVAAATIGAAIVSVALDVLAAFHVAVPVALGSDAATLLAFVFGYFTPSSAKSPE